MHQKKLKQLFQKYIDSASPSEVNEFLLFIQDRSDKEIFELLESFFYDSNVNHRLFSEETREKMLRAILDTQDSSTSENELTQPFIPKRIIPKRRVEWGRYIAIGAVLLIGITIGFLMHQNSKHNTMEVVDLDLEIKPGRDNATLELSDGTLIDLNNYVNGNVFENDGLIVTKTNDGQIVYHTLGISKRDPNESISYNTIRTPKGGQFQIILPDGSKVWLNAASSLTYPETFEGSERKVELQGEGYFDVVKNKDQPFKVLSRGQTVMVLGTQFNINSYDDEPLIKTTLIEGSVKITEDIYKSSVVLNTGEQATIDNTNKFTISKDNVEDAIAWRNGFFRFQGAEIDQVMREISRWYNIEIEIEEKNRGLEFWGEIYRNASISDALEILSYFNLKYKVEKTKESRKIIVF